RFDHIKRIARFGRADLGGIHRVIAKLFLGELMLRVTDLTISGHALGIELDLHLHIRSRHVQRASELAGKFRRSFFWRVDETVTAITIAREHFEQIIVQTFPTDAKAIKRDALLAL